MAYSDLPAEDYLILSITFKKEKRKGRGEKGRKQGRTEGRKGKMTEGVAMPSEGSGISPVKGFQ